MTPLKYRYLQADKESVKSLLVGYFTIISFGLCLSYYLSGLLLKSTGHPNLFYTFSNHEASAYFNGFLLTHMVLGLIYIIIGIVMLISNSSGCYCYMFACPDCDCDGNGDDCDDGCIGCVMVTVIIVGLLGTFLIIYYDVLSRVLERRDMLSKKIKIFAPYESGEPIL
jgi:hypothetical protein